jgi:tartronate-semialdehyde synthase
LCQGLKSPLSLWETDQSSWFIPLLKRFVWICGAPYGNKIFLESDVVLGVGCRFSDRHTGTLDVYTKGRKFIHIDIEPTQIGRIIPTELGIVSDAKLALQALLKMAKQMTPQRSLTSE